MIPKLNIEALSQQLLAILPPGVKQLEQDVHQQFQHILQKALKQLDLVSREEFDVQVKVLARSREKLSALEKRVRDLES